MSENEMSDVRLLAEWVSTYDPKSKRICGQLIPEGYLKHVDSEGQVDTYHLFFACFTDELEFYSLIDTFANAVPDMFQIKRIKVAYVSEYIDPSVGSDTRPNEVTAIYLNAKYNSPDHRSFVNAIRDIFDINRKFVSPAYHMTPERDAIIDYFDNMPQTETDPEIYMVMDVKYAINTGDAKFISDNEYLKYAEDAEYGAIFKLVKVMKNGAALENEPTYKFTFQYVYPFAPAEGFEYVELDDTMLASASGESGLPSGIIPCFAFPTGHTAAEYGEKTIPDGSFILKV